MATAPKKKQQNRRDLIWVTVSKEELEEILAGLDPEGVLYTRLKLKLLESQ